MKYIPSEETEEINYKNDKNPIFNAVILVIGFLVLYSVLLVILGIAGETLAKSIPPRLETSLFSSFNLQLDQKPWPLGQRIADDIFDRNGIDPIHKPSLFISCSSVVNAVALPGKKIIFFKGLLEHTPSLNSVYFIMGHEIGHILNRDHVKGIGRALAISLGLFFINLGSDTNSLFSINQSLMNRSFNRGQEELSDDKAINFTIKRFNGLYASTEFFESLPDKTQNTSRLSEFMNTHPMTQNRIDKIKNHPNYNTTTTIVEKMDLELPECK